MYLLYLAPAKPKTDVTELYLRLINFYLKHRADLSKQEPDPNMVTGLMGLLVETGCGGHIRHRFLDEQIAWDLNATVRFTDALDDLMYVGLSEANRRDRAGDRPGAAGAIWSLRHLGFEHNQRLYPRYAALGMMLYACAQLKRVLPVEKTRQWSDALKSIAKVWKQKLLVFATSSPQIGDLLNVARHDQDPTFRIAATIKLSIAKFYTGTSSNRLAIQKALKNSDPLIRKAAKLADTTTKQEARRAH